MHATSSLNTLQLSRLSSAKSSFSTNQDGFTLIELMITVAVIGVLSAISVASYQTQVRKTQIITIYKEINHFRLPYEILIHQGAGVTDFSPDGLNMPAQTEYCQFSIISPVANEATPNAIRCQIQNLSYLTNQTLSLDRHSDGSWNCSSSKGILKKYLPLDCQ